MEVGDRATKVGDRAMMGDRAAKVGDRAEKVQSPRITCSRRSRLTTVASSGAGN